MKGRVIEIATAIQNAGIVRDKESVGALMLLSALFANRAGLTRMTFVDLMGDMWDEAEETRDAWESRPEA